MAIAYDAVSTGSAGGNTVCTFSHTCTGDDRLLLVGIFDQSGGDNVSGVTYNAVAMTKLGSVTQGATDKYISLWGLIAPATGANNVVATRSSATNAFECRSISYTGVLQTGFPDGTDTTTVTSTSMNVDITTTADNCWLSGIFRNSYDVNSAASGTTLRGTSSSIQLADSNGAKTPAGAYSIGTTWGGSAASGCVGVSFAPSGGAPAATTPLLGLMGVGT